MTVVILVAWPIAIEKSDRFLEFSTLYREIILIPALFRRGIESISINKQRARVDFR